MTEVRIRDDYTAKSAHLADVEFADLDLVIPALSGWGIADYEGAELSGQFVYDTTATTAYFEVVIHSEETP